MDYDAVSNCSGYSNQSDEIRSNASSLSGLSIYQDEFAELRHLVNPLKYPSTFARCSTPKPDSGCELPYDDRISNLSHQLENSLKLNERYKNDLYNLEKNIELRFNEKIEKLLKTNHRLQSQLDNANAQIERLLRNFSTKSNPSSVLDKSSIQLEQKCHELNLENSTLHYQLLQSKNQEKEYELQNNQLKADLNELKIDFEAKTVCIKELKEKISQQYVEIETLKKNNLISSQSLNEVSFELEHIKRMQEWYKQQLYASQKDKKILSDEILKYKNNCSTQNENIETLHVELAKWKNKCDLIQLEALKEKENLWKQLENNNVTSISQHSQVETNFAENNSGSVVNYYETSIQDLTNEITKIKEYVQQQDKTITKISKENSELMAHCVILQKNIQQKEISIEQLENIKHHLNMELNLANDKIKQQIEELTSLNKQIFSLEAELKIRKDEKEMIENAVETVREQFNSFKSKYKKIEEELLTKSKQILQLENEKQKLFMSNNWNICELEKVKEKDEVIKNLKCVVSNCEQKIGNLSCEIKRWENELQEKEDMIKNLKEEKHSIIDKDSLEIQRYEDAFSQYKIMVSNYETQVDDLQKLFDESEKSIRDHKDNIKILKEELNKRDSDLNEMCNKCIDLENKIKICEEVNLKFRNNENLEFYLKSFFDDNKISLVEILGRFMKVYKGGNDTNNRNNKVMDVEVLKAIEKFVHYNLDHGKNNSRSVATTYKLNIKKEVVTKVTQIEDRIKILYGKVEDCSKTLKTLLDFKEKNEQDKIKELNVLLQVKELELKDKQKKYETNNRTLLRKVKEHMKGRNSAEKHNKYLQELYNSLSDENNSLKLNVSSKEYEIENIKKQLESYVSINNRLKQSVLSLEAKLIESKTCGTCMDYIVKTRALESLEKYVKELEDGKLNMQNILMNKEDIIVSLTLENQEIIFKNSALTSEKEKCVSRLEETVREKQDLQNKINGLLNEIKKKQLLVDDLKVAIEEGNINYLERNNENLNLKLSIEEMSNKVEYLSNEIKVISSALQGKSEELKQLEDKKLKMERNWIEKEQTSENTIITLKNYLHDMQTEVNSINSERYFLQRLCNDLKLALRTYVNHNKVLKDKLNSLSKEKQEFNSLPNILPDVSTASKYDDVFINQLLQQHKTPVQGKPLTEIKTCLDTLRKEILTLQEQIAKKNTNIL